MNDDQNYSESYLLFVTILSVIKAIVSGLKFIVNRFMGKYDMNEKSELGNYLTGKQSSILAFRYKEEDDLWLVLLYQYIVSQGNQSERLKSGIVDDTEEWRNIVAEVRGIGFGDLESLACQKTIQWNVYIKQLLSDPGHLNLLRLYLRSLAKLKIKKVIGFGGRADFQKQLNMLIATIANNALASLERVSRANEILSSGQTTSGKKDLGESSIAFYKNYRDEHQKRIAEFLAIFVLVKDIKSQENMDKIHDYISSKILKPMKSNVDSMKGEERKRVGKRVDFYSDLIRSMNISFDQ